MQPFTLAPDLVERKYCVSRGVSVVRIVRQISTREIMRTSLIH